VQFCVDLVVVRLLIQIVVVIRLLHYLPNHDLLANKIKVS
jgi:hypothetical protein